MVFVVGATAVLVPVTAPIPGEMESDVAPVTDQLSVVELPAMIAAGCAANDAMTGAGGGGGGAAVTVTVTFFVTLPPEFVAVSV